MRNLVLAIAVAFPLLAGAPAMAQTHDHHGHGDRAAIETSPADNTMGAAPASFTANFEHAMRLTSLVITLRGGDPIAVTIPASAPSTAVSVQLPPLAPGNYTFAWTAVGADNHTMTGRVRYMVH